MVKIQFLGHSGFKISAANKNILIDPYLSCNSKDQFKRLVNCPIKEDKIGPIDIVLITHEHFDHFDKGLVERICQKNKAVAVAHDSLLEQLNLPRNQKNPISLKEKSVLRGVTIQPVAAHHPTAFYPVGYLIGANGTTVYHAGDTELSDNLSDIKADIALMPIGGKITMDCVDAVKAIKTMKPQYAIPMHYNTFEMIKQDPKEFSQKIQKSILKTKPIIMEPGKSVTL